MIIIDKQIMMIIIIMMKTYETCSGDDNLLIRYGRLFLGCDQLLIRYNKLLNGYDELQIGYDELLIGYDELLIGYDQLLMGHNARREPRVASRDQKFVVPEYRSRSYPFRSLLYLIRS